MAFGEICVIAYNIIIEYSERYSLLTGLQRFIDRGE